MNTDDEQTMNASESNSVNKSHLDKEELTSRVVSSLKRICGGGIHRNSDKTSSPSCDCICYHSSTPITTATATATATTTATKDKSTQSWLKQLEELIDKSILYPHDEKKTSTKATSTCTNTNEAQIGKPHDVEIKIAPSFYHRYKHKCQKITKSKPHHEDHQIIHKPPLEVISDLGLIRSIYSPRDFASLIVQDMEDALWHERVHHDANANANTNTNSNIDTIQIRYQHEIKYDLSGIICIVTPQRNAFLQSTLINRLPCPHRDCVKWVKGSKGLWWHMQRVHEVDYAIAMGAAKDGCKNDESRAIVLYTGGEVGASQSVRCTPPLSTAKDIGGKESWMNNKECGGGDAYFQLIKDGHLPDFVLHLTKIMKSNAINVATHFDKNGASALHWAAGCGHLPIVQYLIQDHSVPPDQPQKGKRSFQDRTPLHWAARNGHLPVVKYLVAECTATGTCAGVNLDAATLDGTTAFCWACWQNHQEIMKYLYEKGADIGKVNSFGCNAVLWSAQSATSGLEALQWLKSTGLDAGLINFNGHGMLHKSAQRGKVDVCYWVFEFAKEDDNGLDLLLQIAPDTEGCCPSDLAGMEGFEVLAQWLTVQETEIAQKSFENSVEDDRPEWLTAGVSDARHSNNRYGLEGTYENGAGVKKMCAFIVKTMESSSQYKRPKTCE